MKQLSESVTNISKAAIPGSSELNTPAHGSISADGKTTMPSLLATQPNLQPDQVTDILSSLRSVKLWQIKPEDQRAAQNALPLLEYGLIPATYDQCAYWLGRLLAHFPRRDTTKDAIVIADIAGAVVEGKMSLLAVAHACDFLWKASTTENPWMPPSGEILEKISFETDYYQRHYHKLKNPILTIQSNPNPRREEGEKMPWEGKKWPDMDEITRFQLVAYLGTFHDLPISRTYATFYDCPAFDSSDFVPYIPEKKKGYFGQPEE